MRPSVIESALAHPFPGWIDGFKVADPLILAFGRGQLPDFPGVPDSVLDVIPVDFVVNACSRPPRRPRRSATPRYLHVASGASNPLPFHAMYENVRDYFTANPIPDDVRGAAHVPTWQFPGDRRVERALTRAERAADARRPGARAPAVDAAHPRVAARPRPPRAATSPSCGASPSSTAPTSAPS